MGVPGGWEGSDTTACARGAYAFRASHHANLAAEPFRGSFVRFPTRTLELCEIVGEAFGNLVGRVSTPLQATAYRQFKKPGATAWGSAPPQVFERVQNRDDVRVRPRPRRGFILAEYLLEAPDAPLKRHRRPASGTRLCIPRWPGSPRPVGMWARRGGAPAARLTQLTQLTLFFVSSRDSYFSRFKPFFRVSWVRIAGNPGFSKGQHSLTSGFRGFSQA
jgi:hypothetical protein